MWVAIALTVGSVLLVVSGFTWAASVSRLARAAAITSLAVRPLASLREGVLAALRAKVRAEASAEEPLVDPVTDHQVAMWEASVARDGAILWADRAGEHLELEDESGRAILELAAAELDIEQQEIESSLDEPSPRMSRLLAAHERDVPERSAGARFTLVHRAIAIGDELTVIGVPVVRESERSARKSSYRGGNGPLPRLSASQGLTIVSERPLAELAAREAADVQSMKWMLRIAVAAGLGMLAIGLGLLLAA
ncbi:MAG: hypothetical protein K8H88_11530 [Sandaracinaceae bacterium]|nr:hypothetical protein [Sandaracinaceae bacterium]